MVPAANGHRYGLARRRPERKRLARRRPRKTGSPGGGGDKVAHQKAAQAIRWTPQKNNAFTVTQVFIVFSIVTRRCVLFSNINVQAHKKNTIWSGCKTPEMLQQSAVKEIGTHPKSRISSEFQEIQAVQAPTYEN